MAERNESPVANSSAPDNVLTTKIDPTSARFEANMRFLADLMSQVRNEGEKICEGGGAKAIESQHAKGRLTARERIDSVGRSGNVLRTGPLRRLRHVRRMGRRAGRGRDHGIGAD